MSEKDQNDFSDFVTKLKAKDMNAIQALEHVWIKNL